MYPILFLNTISQEVEQMPQQTYDDWTELHGQNFTFKKLKSYETVKAAFYESNR